MTERWKPVVGFEGQYEVSDQGRVRSLDRMVFRRASARTKGFWVTVKGRVLRPGPSNYGHLSVVLGRAQGTRMVHALVLEAFIGPRLEREECRHLDGNPKNNRLENLRWGTRSENNLDAVRHGTWISEKRKQFIESMKTDPKRKEICRKAVQARYYYALFGRNDHDTE